MCALYSEGAVPLYKATIVPRGQALGMVCPCMFRPSFEFLYSENIDFGKCRFDTAVCMPSFKEWLHSIAHILPQVTQLPEDDVVSMTRQQMLARLVVAMGGRAAEEKIFGRDYVTSGASSDVESATRLAHAMVTKYAMSDKVGRCCANRA